MKTIQISLVMLFLACLNLNGQNLIGYGEKEVRQYMSENLKAYKFQSFINNSTFKYLKYANDDETVTLLFFLNEQLSCKSVRLVCDKSLRTDKIKEYNSLFKKKDENKWIETKNDKSYLIELKDEEWSFNVTITQNE